MKSLSKNKSLFVLSVISMVAYYIAYYVHSIMGQYVNLMLLFVIILLYSIRNREKTVILLFFLLAFFTFLLSRDFFLILFPFLLDDLADLFEIDTYSQTLKFFALYHSLLFLFWGNLFVCNKFSCCNFEQEISRDLRVVYINRVSLFLFYMTTFFKIWQILTVSHSVFTYSYANVDSSVNLPHSIVLISFLNTASFIFYLNTYPSKTALTRPFLVFLFLTLASVFMGERGIVVYTVLFLLIYFVSRDYYRKVSERFISKKKWCLLLFLAPFVLVGLNLFAFVRSSEEVVSNGFWGDVAGFFLQQGGSSNLIYLVEEYRESLPDTNISYTFGPLINFFTDILNLKSNNVGWDSFTYEALYRNNLGATLTYLTDPVYYYSGGGLGTQYVAELSADYGLLGIIIYNFLLGILLRYVSFDVKKSIVGQVYCSLIIMSLLALPRDFCFSWVLKLISPAYLLSIYVIYVLSVTYYKRYPSFKVRIYK